MQIKDLKSKLITLIGKSLSAFNTKYKTKIDKSINYDKTQNNIIQALYTSSNELEQINVISEIKKAREDALHNSNIADNVAYSLAMDLDYQMMELQGDLMNEKG